MKEEIKERFEHALTNSHLFDLVQQMKIEDISQVQIYCFFEDFRNLLRESNREADEDKIMDVMDYIVGWCSPHMKLFPEGLSNEEIKAFRFKQNVENNT
ncbi:MAG: hypothetical protein ABI954_08900 [Pyrinomonadaceae bacterium]